MEHVVFFPAPDGTPAFRRLVSLEEAVRLVEHLRNVDGVTSASLHALCEVPLSFRTYYRVEVPLVPDVPTQALGQEAPGELAPGEVEPLPGHDPVPVLALVEDVQPPSPAQPHPEQQREPAQAGGNGYGTPVSLGFFA